ncbi:MAG: hypothetical protein MCS20_01975, partial [Candidatus Phytoplasma mali]|nr:hypothetical protein [Candidatus Phytoplasma mali]MCZ8632760.1 hypothetical protein [Spiroplasma sp. Tabriz.8]
YLVFLLSLFCDKKDSATYAERIKGLFLLLYYLFIYFYVSLNIYIYIYIYIYICIFLSRLNRLKIAVCIKNIENY